MQSTRIRWAVSAAAFNIPPRRFLPIIAREAVAKVLCGRFVGCLCQTPSGRTREWRFTETPYKRLFQPLLVCLALSWGGFAAISEAQSPPVTVPLPAPSLPADPLPRQPKVATVGFGPGLAVSARRNKVVFQQVGVQPLQVVSIALQYPVALAGTIVAAEPLDGGRILTAQQSLVVAADGLLNLSYELGAKPGLYQVRLHYDEKAIALQFWVFDADHPENNPDVLRPH